MKKKITLLSFIILITLFSFSQRKGLKDNKYYHTSGVEIQNKNLNRGESKYDKGHLFIKGKKIFQNSRINSFQGNSSQLVIKYGLDYEISQSWNETSSQWINDYKNDYTYDTNGNVIEIIPASWDAGHWAVNSKTEYTYDTNGNLIQDTDYYWFEDQWVVDGKTQYTYDTNGNLIQHIDYYWDGSQWVAGNKTQYIYDTNGNLLQDIDYYWNGSYWINERKTQYSYDTNGNLIQDIDYYWFESQWINDWKTEYIYNTIWNLTKLINYRWYESQWFNAGKTEYTYDINRNLEQLISYYWNGSQWGNESLFDYNYNNTYSFSDLILPYFYSNTYVKIFFNHMLTNGLRYVWDETLNDWIIRNNYDLSYSEHDILSISEIIEEQIKIYPNPVSNILTIKSDYIQIEKIEIYSVLGKKIKEINLDFNNINAEDLSKGIYLLWIYSEKGTLIKKLIKK